MLAGLSIRDLAVVDTLELEFESGFTVLTGETGAGKSILLTALGLALGDRADSGLIRPGAQRAEVHVTFELDEAGEASGGWKPTNCVMVPTACCDASSILTGGRKRSSTAGQ